MKNFFLIVLSFIISIQITLASSDINHLFEHYQASVLQDGIPVQRASTLLTAQILASNHSIDDIKKHLLSKMTEQEKNEFLESIDRIESEMQNQDSTQLTDLWQNALNKIILQSSRTGANFTGCQLGVGIGIGLLATSIITGILAYKNIKHNKDIDKQIEAENEQLENDINNFMHGLASNGVEISPTTNIGLSAGLGNFFNYSSGDYDDIQATLGSINSTISYEIVNQWSDIHSAHDEQVEQLQDQYKKDQARRNTQIAAVSLLVGGTVTYISAKSCQNDYVN
jgi:hypothetical protein